jgi:hypothetical protein
MSNEPNMFEVDLEAIDFEALMASTDRFSLVILNSIYSPEQIKKLDDQGLARSVAFETCYRYMEAMRVMAERYTEMESAKAWLTTLL